MNSHRIMLLIPLLGLLSACAVPSAAPADPSPFSTPVPPDIKAQTVEAKPSPTWTPEPTHAGTQATPRTTWPTPTYEVPLAILPEECFPPDPSDEIAAKRYERCSDFTFSLDGRYLGFLFGPRSCGRGLRIQDALTGELVFEPPFWDITSLKFLVSNKVMITTSYCEGGSVGVIDLSTGESTWLGDAPRGQSNLYWNPSETAFAVSASPYHGYENAVWGYNALEDFLFLPQPETWQLDHHMLWTPDGSHLVYQHRGLILNEETGNHRFLPGRQIILVNVATGEKSILASDLGFDFHLCEGMNSGCDVWHGDWIQVRKLPAQSLEIQYPAFEEVPGYLCVQYGMACPGNPVLLALNWRTGEMIPWDASLLPTPIPTITPTPGGERG